MVNETVFLALVTFGAFCLVFAVAGAVADLIQWAWSSFKARGGFLTKG